VTKLDALYERLPRLEPTNHTLTSQDTDKYNCVAWITRDMERWWEPGFYWPPGVPEPDSPENDLGCYLTLFEELGYEACAGPDLEPGFLKIALYARDEAFHHVAKQLRSGAWSSKIGYSFDLRHDDLDALYDGAFFERATATVYMRRPDDGADPMEIEESNGIILPPGV
jgi:hypothetical protein